MTPELRAVAAQQGGVFLRRQAMAVGYTKREVEALLRNRTWARLRWGAYAEQRLVDAVDDAGRYLMLVRAALLRLDAPAVASHNSAAVLHGLPLWRTDLDTVHVTRSSVHCGRREAGVSHHEAGIDAPDITSVDGVDCTSLRRTALDVTREFGFEAGVVAADAVLSRGVPPTELTQVARRMRDWPGASQVVRVARFADAGAESPGESLARIFLVELGLPRPRTQVVLRSGAFAARVDLLVKELGWVFEFDGRLKYRRQRDACDGVVDDADVVWAEKRREDALRDELDLAVSRLVWSDLFGARRQQKATQLRAKAEQLRAKAERLGAAPRRRTA